MGDVSCAQGENHVSFFGLRGNDVCSFGEESDVAGVLAPVFFNTLGQGFSRNAGNGLFAGGVDVEHDEGVGIGEGLGEFLHQCLGTGVAVGLEDNVNAAVAALAGGGERGEDLGGVMAVIVDHTYAGCASAKLEAAVYTAETVERAADVAKFDVQACADGDGRGGVQYVVGAGNVQREFAQIFSAIGDLEAAHQAVLE